MADKMDDLYIGSLFDYIDQGKEFYPDQTPDKDNDSIKPSQVIEKVIDNIPVISQSTVNIPASTSRYSLNRLTETQKNEVLKLLHCGEKSAIAICEQLIKEHGATDKRYTTGKPDIYVDVCIYIDLQVQEGICKLVSKQNEDRIYEWLI